MDKINNMIVDYVNFAKFFYNDNPDSYSFIGCWHIIDNVRCFTSLPLVASVLCDDKYYQLSEFI